MSVSAQDIKPNYRIAINKTSYPHYFINNENQPEGMMVDIWRLWADKQKVNIEFVPLNFQQTLRQVESGQVDIHAGLFTSEIRAKVLDFSSAFFRQSRHLFLHRSIANIKDISQLAPYAIGVVEGSSHIISLLQEFPNISLKYFPNRNALYQAAINGDVLVVTGVEKLSKNYSNYNALNQQFPMFNRIAYISSDYSGAVAKGNQVLLELIEQGMSKITPKEMTDIQRKWLVIDKSDNVITFAFADNQLPFSQRTPSGNANGFFIELWRMWAENIGLEVEFIASNAASINAMLKEGIDIQLTSLSQATMIEEPRLGPIIYNVEYGMFLANESKAIAHISEIKNKRIGVISSPDFVNDIQQKVSNANIVHFSDYASMLLAAKQGTLDIIAGQRDIIKQQLINHKLWSNYSRLQGYVFKRDVHAIINALDSKYSQIIKEGFDATAIEDLVTLERKWGLEESSGFFKRQLAQLALTEQEAAWLNEHRVVNFGIVKNWAPIEFVDKFGEVKGTNPDLFRLITQRLNIEINYVTYDNFSDLYEALVMGDVDVIGSVNVTKERQEKLIFTTSYWSMPWVIVHPRELGSQLALDNFYGKTMAIAKGDYFISELRKKHPEIKLRLVNDSEEGVLAVQSGAVEGFIDSLSSGTELLKRESLVSLSLSVLKNVEKNSNHLAINKNLPILASILNKSVLTISDADSQQVYEKWFDINISSGLDKSVVLRVAGQIGVLITIIIVIIMVWNRRLYVEVSNRKKLEKKMQYMATHDDLTGLANRVLLKDRLHKAITFHQRQSLLLAVLFIDLDGFKNINDSYGHDAGDELLIEVAKRLKNCVRESDTVVRFGGDEFVVLLTGLHSQSEAGYVANKILKVTQQPILMANFTAQIGCSIGIAMYPDDGDTHNDLLNVADSSMYNVKATGKNHFSFNRKAPPTG